METSAPPKKVLIITYYWPPSGGSGVQRWLKFAKYLHQEGWETFVCTPENPSFTTQDPSLQKDVPAAIEVWRLPIWEPYQLFERVARIFGRKKISQTDFVVVGKKSWFQRIAAWLRGNLLIPDARIFWIRPATHFLEEMIRSNGIDKVITTGPPHSIHLIGLRLKKRNPALKWVADFRDPWSQWDLLDTLSLSSWARKKHHALERAVLQNANRVITIAPFHVQLFEKLGGRKVDLITNGFDAQDFVPVPKKRTEKFTIRHIGIVDELRDPRPVMEAIREFLREERNADRVVVEFIGNVNSSFKSWVEEDDALASVTRFVSYMPHADLLTVYASTDLQILVLAHTAIAPGNLPGKFFEYLASRNPILAIGPRQGDAAEILRDTKAGEIYDRSDVAGMTGYLTQRWKAWLQNESFHPTGVDAYTRQNLTRKLIEVLNQL